MCNSKILDEKTEAFHLRFYFPKQLVAKKHAKVDRIVILLNGLNEVNDYKIYDQLAANLAEHNIAAVLLPLPEHLNRNIKHKPGNHSTLPTEPFEAAYQFEGNITEKIFKQYLQIMKEIDPLRSHLTYLGCSQEKTNCLFFKFFFNKNTRVSILGYSLGSTIALASFMNHPNKYNTCFVLNGGFKLDSLRAGKLFDRNPNISQTKWNTFLSKFEKECTHLNQTDPYKNNLPYAHYFEKIYLGNHGGDYKNTLNDYTRKMLFIIGGKDGIIPSNSLESFEPPHGFSIFKIPGLSHFLRVIPKSGV